MNHWSRELYVKAWDYATRQHAGQTYGGRTKGMRIDYLNHIGSVAMEVIWCLQHARMEYDGDLAVQCAILHDTIEDTSTTHTELVELFGRQVADGVLALSKDESIPDKQGQLKDSLKRILLQPTEISLVKVADRIANLYHPPYYWDNAKIESYVKDADLIYLTLEQADPLLRERLKEKIERYLQFKR